MQGFFITGTDTNVGKTLVSSVLMLHFPFVYWKPIQSGNDLDIDYVKKKTNLGAERFIKTIYQFKDPIAPHIAAKRLSIEMNLDDIFPQDLNNLSNKGVIIEGAGGLFVPINKKYFIIDLIKKISLPVILVCRSSLGTINHTLLSVNALRSRNIFICGLVINGDKNQDNKDALQEYCDVPIIAEIDNLDVVSRENLCKIPIRLDLLNQYLKL
ncbi:MAG: dethiobiotin synthase [Proteobacteria bacterium]|nr:dethiobiotin synthase [Pseudomonadota bacterium]